MFNKIKSFFRDLYDATIGEFLFFRDFPSFLLLFLLFLLLLDLIVVFFWGDSYVS